MAQLSQPPTYPITGEHQNPVEGCGHPQASIIIPHFNQTKALIKCLESLEAQYFERDKYELIVADNNTPGGTNIVEMQFPKVRFIVETKRGAAHARNAAVACARGQFLAFTDADCIANSNWLARGIDALKRCDIIAGKMVIFAKDKNYPNAIEIFDIITGFKQEHYVKKENFGVTANLFCKKEIFYDVGNFVDGMPEDRDWVRRSVAQGYSICYEEKAIIYHPARSKLDQLYRKWERLTREKYMEMRTQRFFKARWFIRTIMVFASIFLHGPILFFKARKYSIKKSVEICFVLCKIRVFRVKLMLNIAMKKLSPKRI